MRVHLIRTDGVDDELFAGVVSLLQAIPGPIRVTGDPVSLLEDLPVLETGHASRHKHKKGWENHRKIEMVHLTSSISFPPHARHWRTYFHSCRLFRTSFGIPNEDLVILLTETPNHRNWFSALQEPDAHDGFIHTGDWELFVHAPPVFPVAYEVVALVLQQPLYKSFKDLSEHVHEEPVGCVNDFCTDKRQIILKLRTADICMDCMKELATFHPMPVIEHALHIMESLREKMLYAQNFRQNSTPSRLLITRDNRIFVPDHANIEISLRPLEKILYFLFLQHPEGLLLSDLCDHREELFTLYAAISNNGGREEMWQRVHDLTNITTNSASEKISRIKRAFETALGVALAQHYFIRGEVGEAKRISLDRSLVEYVGR